MNRQSAVLVPGAIEPYRVLGVDKSASQDDIKQAYRKLCLKNHPDKNPGNDEALATFQRVCAAYEVVGDPARRRVFDTRGHDGLVAADMELDLSQMGPGSTFVAAMFSKLGVPIKTTVPPHLLEAISDGGAQELPLSFGRSVTGHVGKSTATCYVIDITQEHIDAGFVISAWSAPSSKFKLLMFDKSLEDGRWSMLVQEDSSKLHKHSAAGLFFLNDTRTYYRDKTLAAQDMQAEAEVPALFRTLNQFTQRDKTDLTPGTYLVALYGDNFFKKVSFNLEARLPEEVAAASEAVRDVDERLVTMRGQLAAFEEEFKAAQAKYVEAVERCAAEELALASLLKERDVAYTGLMGLPGSEAARKEASPGEGGWEPVDRPEGAEAAEEQSAPNTASAAAAKGVTSSTGGGGGGSIFKTPWKRLFSGRGSR